MKFENEKHLLNYHEMDNLHKEFIDIYNNIEGDSIESYKSVMLKLFEQTKRHFDTEEKEMDEYSYPRKKEHIDEHQKLLGEMEYFINRSNSKMGQMMLKSYYKEKLPGWFDLHLLSMDSDLSAFLKGSKQN